MHKKKLTLVIFLLIIIILIIASLTLISQGNQTDRVASLYKKISESKKYTFEMEEMDSDFNYKMTVSQRENDINIDTESEGERSSTLILENRVYVIMHNLQEYYSVDSEDIDGDIIISGFKDVSKKEYTIGREEIDGKTYYYEEYKDISNFLILMHETEDSNTITRFYFDNENLLFIKNKVIDENDEQEELLKITVIFDVEDSVFMIPNDYAEL